MSKTISFRGGKAVASVASTGPVPFPVFSLPATTVNVDVLTGGDVGSALYAAFTPHTGTTVTINPTGHNAITWTNATARKSLCSKDPIEAGLFLAATARRKPGTTASMVAQTVTITINSVEIGRFNVEAAAANVNPRCGFFSTCQTELDNRILTNGLNISVGISTLDPELEIVLWVAGHSN